MSFTTNTNAPDMLLDIIAEVGSVLARSKDSDSSKFWIRVLGVMKYSFAYMNDLGWILQKNEILEAENRFLKSYSVELQSRLDKYEVIETEKLNGSFDETVKKVEAYIGRK